MRSKNGFIIFSLFLTLLFVLPFFSPSYAVTQTIPPSQSIDTLRTKGVNLISSYTTSLTASLSSLTAIGTEVNIAAIATSLQLTTQPITNSEKITSMNRIHTLLTTITALKQKLEADVAANKVDLVTSDVSTLVSLNEPVIQANNSAATLYTKHKKRFAEMTNRAYMHISSSSAGLTDLQYKVSHVKIDQTQKKHLLDIISSLQNFLLDPTTGQKHAVDEAVKNKDIAALTTILRSLYSYKFLTLYIPQLTEYYFVDRSMFIAQTYRDFYTDLFKQTMNAQKRGQDISAITPLLTKMNTDLTTADTAYTSQMIPALNRIILPLEDASLFESYLQIKKTVYAQLLAARLLLVESYSLGKQINTLLLMLPTPTPSPTITPIPTATPTSTPVPPTPTPTTTPVRPTPTLTKTPTDQGYIINQGASLGTRVPVTGAMAWRWSAVGAKQLVLFKNAKELSGINTIRLMNVVGRHNESDKSTTLFTKDEDWQDMDNRIATLKGYGFTVVMCAGEEFTPSNYKGYTPSTGNETLFQTQLPITFGLLLRHVAKNYPDNPIELFNEYGLANSGLIPVFYNELAKFYDENPSVSLRIILPGAHREDIVGFEKTLKYFKEQNDKRTAAGQRPILVEAISAHFYEHGASGNVLTFSKWYSDRKTIMDTYNFGDKPLWITEYGLDGTGGEKLVTSFNAAWFSARLGDTTFYSSKIQPFISAIYGHGYANSGGHLGLFAQDYGSTAPFPIERALEIEKKLGDKLYTVTGIPDTVASDCDRKVNCVGGVTDGRGQWLFWNLSGKVVNIKVPSKISKYIARIDAQNGNSFYVMTQSNTDWARPDNIKMLYRKSNPFNSSATGSLLSPMGPLNATSITTTINPEGVVFIGKEPISDPN